MGWQIVTTIFMNMLQLNFYKYFLRMWSILTDGIKTFLGNSASKDSGGSGSISCLFIGVVGHILVSNRLPSLLDITDISHFTITELEKIQSKEKSRQNCCFLTAITLDYTNQVSPEQVWHQCFGIYLSILQLWQQ